MRKKKHRLKSGVLYNHRVECSLQAARNSNAATAQLIENLFDQRTPNIEPPENRIEAAERALDKATMWLKAAQMPI